MRLLGQGQTEKNKTRNRKINFYTTLYLERINHCFITRKLQGEYITYQMILLIYSLLLPFHSQQIKKFICFQSSFDLSHDYSCNTNTITIRVLITLRKCGNFGFYMCSIFWFKLRSIHASTSCFSQNYFIPSPCGFFVHLHHKQKEDYHSIPSPHKSLFIINIYYSFSLSLLSNLSFPQHLHKPHLCHYQKFGTTW